MMFKLEINIMPGKSIYEKVKFFIRDLASNSSIRYNEMFNCLRLLASTFLWSGVKLGKYRR